MAISDKSGDPVKRRADRVRYERERQERRRKAGICKVCPLPITGECRFCLYHWIHDAKKYTGHNDPEFILGLIQKLKDQGYRCAVTGDLITPGLNASLDHIVPRSAGGEATLDNLQWVTKQVNTAKSNLSSQEFIELCRKVILHGRKSIH